MKKIILALALLSRLCMAQSTDTPDQPLKFYKLEFVVKDLEAGKLITAKNYSMIVLRNRQGRESIIRAGSKFTVAANAGTSYQLDVGTSIDCSNISDVGEDLSVFVTAEIGTVAGTESDPHPVIRQYKWSSFVIVPMKKPTIIFSSDDATTKRVMQLELTATPVKQ